MKKYLFAQEISKFCQLFDVSFSTKHRGFICFALLFSNPVLAQFNETIRTGRPGQAIGAFTVGKGVLQVQSGFDVFGSQNSRTKLKSNGFLNNTVVRYGLTETFEVSTLVEYKTETNEQNDIRTNLQGLSAFDVGMRYHIFTGKGLIPTYQINAYTEESHRMASIYSDLHQNIQDKFNEGGVEILSPHYRASRDGNMTSIPANYLPKDYKAPTFNVSIKNDSQDKKQ